MIDRDFPRFFSQLALMRVFYPNAKHVFTLADISSKDWPECEAKTLLLEFEALSESKGETLAKLKMGPTIEMKLHREIGLQLPTEPISLKALYSEYLSVGMAMELASALMRTPDKFEELITRARRNSAKGVKTVTLTEAVKLWITDLDQKITTGKAVVEIPGFEILSRSIGGFNPGRVSLLVAQTGRGKTTLAQNLLLGAQKKMPALYFNMEMSIEDIAQRFISAATKQSHQQLSRGNVDYEKLTSFCEELAQSHGISLTDGASLTVDQICALVVAEKAKNQDLAFVVVDYDQKIARDGYRDEWMTLLRAVENLEEVSKKCDVHIVILSQGDESGDPKASKRSKQPASCCIHFFEENGKHFIELIKNRFGESGIVIECVFDGARSLVREVGIAGGRTGLKL